ncbi:hypothetical protein [Nocardia donostiensis]|uniref:DUF2694 domain-containing protein n=1 Tax=Nocardia donostiensis TaxID=1538463 RepID=A0A1W0B2N8_9NOCA|nr:hypothetical protein [Nocardia donostiensis]ONM46350.1 hypothetical protein B0T46_23495 [Nocardia donostiensis]OQS16671.1 hypothetical protein B0T36_03085 [Nocardia donostiensis]OQS18667.1 hypothetical protein B0T44_18385 [Nocardia donostiensis]
MTNNYDDADNEQDAPDWRTLIYEVFNPDHTVGVACDRDGEIVGLHITDEARENGDTWLAAEIVRIARLAHMKSRLGLRKEMEHRGARPHTIDSFDLPTEAGYRTMENQEFGSRAY